MIWRPVFESCPPACEFRYTHGSGDRLGPARSHRFVSQCSVVTFPQVQQRRHSPDRSPTGPHLSFASAFSQKLGCPKPQRGIESNRWNGLFRHRKLAKYKEVDEDFESRSSRIKSSHFPSPSVFIVYSHSIAIYMTQGYLLERASELLLAKTSEKRVAYA